MELAKLIKLTPKEKAIFLYLNNFEEKVFSKKEIAKILNFENEDDKKKFKKWVEFISSTQKLDLLAGKKYQMFLSYSSEFLTLISDNECTMDSLNELVRLKIYSINANRTIPYEKVFSGVVINLQNFLRLSTWVLLSRSFLKNIPDTKELYTLRSLKHLNKLIRHYQKESKNMFSSMGVWLIKRIIEKTTEDFFKDGFEKFVKFLLKDFKKDGYFGKSDPKKAFLKYCPILKDQII